MRQWLLLGIPTLQPPGPYTLSIGPQGSAGAGISFFWSVFVEYEISFFSHLLNAVIILLGLLLILTILIQRGKGGGLIGAFGGAGGSSPFGSKAGDTFTRITITMAGIWVLLIMIQVRVAKSDTFQNTRGPGNALISDVARMG
jgi:preprotein translocase subunit SecG